MKTPTKASVKQGASRAKAFASEKIKETSTVARARIKETGAAVRANADAASKKVSEGVDGYPVAALVGGLAIGAVVAALLPRTKTEDAYLGEVGETINARAKDALGAARDAGIAKLGELGISTDAAGKQVGKLIDSAAKVAEVAGSAAIEAVQKH